MRKSIFKGKVLMRRYWEVDLDILTEINPEFTVFTLYDKLAKETLKAFQPIQQLRLLEEDGFIIFNPKNNKFQVIIINHSKELTDRMLNILERVLETSIPLVPANPSKYKIRYCFF